MAGINLSDASAQWGSRPADERFASLSDLHAHCEHFRSGACTAVLPSKSLRAVVDKAVPSALLLEGRTGTRAHLTHWAFGQLSQRAEAPASYLRTLAPELAAECLNAGLSKSEGTASLLFHQNGVLSLHAATSEQYTRIWNADITSRLLDLASDGWRTPPARPAHKDAPGARIATEADCLRTSLIRPGEMIAPAGLYASDRDMFAFMVNESARIDDGSDEGLSRGFFASNSEVGDKAFNLKTFLYKHVCGNHIVWDVKDVIETRIIHKGSADLRAFGRLSVELRAYANGAASEDEARIKATQRFMLADDKDALLDMLFGKRIAGQKTLEAAYAKAVEHEEDGSPLSAWGFAQGLTRVSQDAVYTDDRAKLDAAAGKVLEMAF